MIVGTIKYRRRRCVGPPEDERPEVWRHINDYEPEDGDSIYLDFIAERSAVAKAWAKHRHTIIERFARQHPGTRPRMWWLEPGREPRQRVGGVGVPCRYGRHLDLGADYFYDHENFSFTDSPLFESQPHYLRRLDLLLRGEASRLREEDFQPVRVEYGSPSRDDWCPICGVYLRGSSWRRMFGCLSCHTRFASLRGKADESTI